MTVMDYRTQDGLADYGFAIEFQPDGGWRVYIIFLPLHQGHDDSLQLPYQSIDRHGRRYVNWSSKLDNLGEARTVAALWAELIHRYQCSQEGRRVAPASLDRRGDAVADASHPGHSSRGPATPHPALEAV
ncbi:MAG: hypothetical protein ACRDRR_13330 [Pseudonocardiaceae bacterium]